MNLTPGNERFDGPETRDITNEIFREKPAETFQPVRLDLGALVSGFRFQVSGF